ncbi:hypothetical protein SELMODRAFT_117682 [Selaginella moellendorffii]|uniref:Leucine-rich repeat-containing N-terminal plant-type domain-containing protein n=1 Tax=Selaginella moellendorffii TaxID=88036 RepID=D8SID5_SELML|nr:probable LRR receptor-like serine/threonine-protein kinase At4g36180 [Selaginella moellendorffii]XP_024543833.1 probable LRR receptor-like serine/threonine-protein kinase At4g36180 [Selaginella moellendorffii]XP_024543834.1 probable LRR receptor-like serine/threonine-protein kinase At4g36180 [Selaginella moellendorffii]EFJ15851.1 hypothetical protein SELMODRAFT_117682 [Selaginella moellendorffii]|eukprot:XP_002983042.1 probable LRR receptor-like serine/threonine-protein kinase At4g36180 [Selaginella moellendorffii]
MALVLIFLLAIRIFPATRASTLSSDLQALKDVKAAVDPSSIHSTTCLGSWDFAAADPCDSRSTSHFVCGIGCSSDDPLSRRVISLILDGSGYNGTLSPSLGSLTALQVLDFSGNSFHGTIPASLGQLTSLIKLDLSRNSFTGAIPDTISQLSNLSYLSVANNHLEGPIPSSIANLSTIERLFLHNNQLAGKIPSLDGLQRLSYFDASNNRLSELPLKLPVSLLQLSLRSNQLGGSFPQNLVQLQGLEVLDLSYNQFVGHLDSSLFELPSLQQLTVSHNQISSLGVPRLSNVESELVAVDISYNQLEGALPVFLANISRLSALSLRYNNFSGTIPYEFASKASSASNEVQPLMRLFLDGNYLIGEVPQPFLEVPGRFSASFIYNCLAKCPESFAFCQGGGQRPKSECPTL